MWLRKVDIFQQRGYELLGRWKKARQIKRKSQLLYLLYKKGGGGCVVCLHSILDFTNHVMSYVIDGGREKGQKFGRPNFNV